MEAKGNIVTACRAFRKTTTKTVKYRKQPDTETHRKSQRQRGNVGMANVGMMAEQSQRLRGGSQTKKFNAY